MQLNFKLLLIIIASTILASCARLPKGGFDSDETTSPPDYSNLEYWAASPFKEDFADRTPEPQLKDIQDSAIADVFFLHPTTYTNERGNNEWNAAFDNKKLNKKTDETTILFQASVFNGAGRIFAPRYRQAHIFVFYNKNDKKKKIAERALDFAYQDIKSAFEYYLEHHNNGRPIIIASHSQGTIHAITLIKDFFEGKPLMDQLVVAYLIGMPVRETTFEELPPCEDEKDIQCFNTWRSYQRGYLPKWTEENSNIVVTNPLSWSRDTSYVSKDENKGTLLTKFNKGLFPDISDAQIYEDHLWVSKPKFPGSIFITFKNYHIADYNLYYGNIRENAASRVEQFMIDNKVGNGNLSK